MYVKMSGENLPTFCQYLFLNHETSGDVLLSSLSFSDLFQYFTMSTYHFY